MSHCCFNRFLLQSSLMLRFLPNLLLWLSIKRSCIYSIMETERCLSVWHESSILRAFSCFFIAFEQSEFLVQIQRDIAGSVDGAVTTTCRCVEGYVLFQTSFMKFRKISIDKTVPSRSDSFTSSDTL
ncbi:hypothetical protein Tco_0272222 [Tanacetum coccineum]